MDFSQNTLLAHAIPFFDRCVALACRGIPFRSHDVSLGHSRIPFCTD
jgi:hypothetical protein